MRWKSAALAAVVAATTALSACSDSEDPNALVVYNAQHESLTKQWAEAFTKETGIKVTLRQGGDTELGNQLVAEGAKSKADVFLTENSPAMVLVENAGLFADVAPATLAQVPAQYRPSTGKWTGIAARATVFAYNKDKVQPAQLPESMADLAGPDWRGRWGAPPPKADFQAIVAAYLELKGEAATREWLQAMKSGAKHYKDNVTTLKGVNAGEIDGGIIYHYYWFSDRAKTGENTNHTELHYFRNSDPGAYVSVSGGGVLAAGTKQDKAQQFLAFVTGKGGQGVLRDGNAFEYTVGSEVPSNPKLVPLAELNAPAVDASKLDAKKVNQLMTEAGLL